MAPINSRLLLAAASAVLAGACATGSGGAGVEAPTTPAGVNVYIQLEQSEVQGELVEVSDSGFVIIRGSRIAYISMIAVRVGRFGWGSAAVIRRGARPHVVLPITPDVVGVPARLRELRLMSRYPGGMSVTVRAALLAAYGQTAPEVLLR